MAIIGIDLGTTFSVVATMKDNKPCLIPNAEGEYLTPSVVGFDSRQHVYVGNLGNMHATLNPAATIRSIKRKMGTDALCRIYDNDYTPPMISSFILKKLKNDAEAFLKEIVTDAVITVPAYFSDVARQATQQAALIAGLNVLRIINEPTAATLAYGLDQKEGELVMVLDLGGGTFDVSILEFEQGVYQVKSTCGDTHLGGDDWTQVIYQDLSTQFQQQFALSDTDYSKVQNRIFLASEKAKQNLTLQEKVTISMPTALHQGRWKALKIDYTREQFEFLSQALCDRLRKPIHHALKDANIKPRDLQKTILVGGATRMPMVRRLVARLVGKEPFVNIDPDKVVALGAAIQAGIINGVVKNVVLVDVVPLSLGIESEGDIFSKLIPRNSKVPIAKDKIFTTAVDDQTEVEIHVLQGERELAKHNISLGKFTLSDLPEAPKGMPKINVTFSIDVNGVLTVKATDIYSETEKEMIIQSDKQKNYDIDKLIEEAKLHHESDEKERELITARIELDRLSVATKAALEEIGDPYDLSAYMVITEMLQTAELLMKDGDLNELKMLKEKINAAMNSYYMDWQKTKEKTYVNKG